MLYMYFVRYFAGFIVWILILSYFVLISVLGGLSYQKSQYYYNLNLLNSTSTDTNTKTNYQTFYILAFTIWGFELLCFGIFVCMFNKIRLAIAIIKVFACF
jgi:choline transporter-like protein 2/4/5